MKDGRFETYEEFWPFYVSEHGSKTTRYMHIAGTLGAVTLAAFGVATRRWYLVPAALVVGYGPAWVSHFFIEKNRPATFKYPLWSLRADFRMLRRTLAGTFPNGALHE